MASPVPIFQTSSTVNSQPANTAAAMQSPPAASSPSSSLAAARPRRSSNNPTARSTSASRQSRSRGYSASTAALATSPYASSPSATSPAASAHPQLSSSADRRQQSKFEKLFGSNGSSHAASTSQANTAGPYATKAQTGAPLSPRTAAPPISPSSPHPKSGITLTRRNPAATAQRVNHRANSNANGHADMHPVGAPSMEDDNNGDDDDEGEGEDDTVVEFSSSPGGTQSIASNSLGLGGIHNNKASSSSSTAGGGSKKTSNLLRCERCHKVYHHPQSLIKHRWQHTEIWSDASRYGLSKHQTVQALEAAVILANPDTLRLLPNDKSHWPAAVSPATSGLLGSEKLNIEILRKQAEVNERELEDDEKAGNLRAGPPNIRRAASAASSMQMYSKSVPAHVGRRRSGLAFSLHNDTMEGDDEEDQEDGADIKDDATMATQPDHERGDDGDEDDDSTESEDENIIAGNLKSVSEMESMDQDMFSLDISSSSPYARPSVLPPVAENGGTAGTSIPTSTRSGLSYSRRNYTTSPSVALPAERYTFLPTIPSSSSLNMSDGFAMSAIPSSSLRARNRSSSHTRSTRDADYPPEHGARENSASSTDESGISGSASIGAATTGGSSDEAISHATRDSGYVSTGHDLKASQQAQDHIHGNTVTTPVRPAIDPSQTASISMSAPVLGFFTERSPVSSFTNRGAPATRQQAGHGSPRVGPVPDHSPFRVDEVPNGFSNGNIASIPEAQAIPGYTPLEAQAAEILSTSYQSQSGPRSFSQTQFGSSYGRSPGYHPYRSASPFPSSARLPSSSLSQGKTISQYQQQHSYSSSPSTATGQAYSFGQAPLGTSYRSTSFNLTSPAPAQPKHLPMSPLARPADSAEGTGINVEDDDEMMDMDL